MYFFCLGNRMQNIKKGGCGDPGWKMDTLGTDYRWNLEHPRAAEFYWGAETPKLGRQRCVFFRNSPWKVILTIIAPSKKMVGNWKMTFSFGMGITVSFREAFSLSSIFFRWTLVAEMEGPRKELIGMSLVNPFADILTPWWTSWFSPDSDSLFFFDWRLKLEVHPFNSNIDVNDLPRFEHFPKKIDKNSRSKRFSLRSRTSSKWWEVKGKISVHRRKSNSRSRIGEFSVEKDVPKSWAFFGDVFSTSPWFGGLEELKKTHFGPNWYFFFFVGVY